jgi:hypothetical protein
MFQRGPSFKFLDDPGSRYLTLSVPTFQLENCQTHKNAQKYENKSTATSCYSERNSNPFNPIINLSPTQRRDNDGPRSVDFSLCLPRHLLRELRYGCKSAPARRGLTKSHYCFINHRKRNMQMRCRSCETQVDTTKGTLF